MADHVARFVSAPADKEAEIEKAFVEWQRENSIVLGAKQAEAVRNLKYRISIVTGGPGTGKTTTLRAIMDVYHKVFKQDPILLMAPTGLAAKRMTDSTHMAADTIHHACGLVPANSASGFSPAKDCTIRPGFIGIDEMSMVGTHLFGFAMDAIDMFDTTAHPNANAVIIGATGSGKTFTAQLFALRLSLMNVQTFVIAPLKGREDYMGGCNAVGGQFVSMDPSAYNNINIMDIRVPDDEDLMRMEGYTDRGALLTKKIHTIKTFLGLVVRDLTQEEEQLLDTCLYSLYGRFGITTDNDSLFDAVTHEYKKMPLLGDLYEEMAGVEELHRVRNILSPLINGSLAAYNRPTNIDLDSKYIVFDFNGLKGDLLVLSMFIVLDFVWSKIKEDRTKRKAVFIDECWKLIGTDSNRRAAEDVVEIFRTIRAYGGSAFAMTQDVSQFFEFENGKYGKAVIGNADTKIVMHLQPNEAYMLQEAVQLTDAEIDNIIKLQTGHGFVASSGGKLFVEFLASPYEKYAITTDANEMYRRGQAIRAAKEKNG